MRTQLHPKGLALGCAISEDVVTTIRPLWSTTATSRSQSEASIPLENVHALSRGVKKRSRTDAHFCHENLGCNI